MRHENGVPAVRRPPAVLSKILVIAFVFGGILAAIVVGIESLSYWVGTYLVPFAVILGVITAILALLVWVIKRSPDPPYRDRLQ
jgi:type VI protein secretion system component VasK